MLVNGPLGFSVTSAISSVGKGAYRVASNPAVQQAAAVVGQQYAPDQTAQIQQYARSVSHNITQARRILNPSTGQMVPMGPPMPPPDYGADAGGGSMPVQHSNMLVYAGIGAGALILLLLLRK